MQQISYNGIYLYTYDLDVVHMALFPYSVSFFAFSRYVPSSKLCLSLPKGIVGGVYSKSAAVKATSNLKEFLVNNLKLHSRRGGKDMPLNMENLKPMFHALCPFVPIK
ncbi:hypothetical protein L6452_06181 [Arctium lappa]|uniref:Uncharacterized protein n=1 Tax=Arctium lappa TaxID=4217 RepID=A0ACB9EI60_ARCLA|nr:hypothetical protein L6452_06181 [Arctium lappa]